MAVQAALLAAGVALIDAAVGRWMWPRMRAALWGAVLLRLLIPPTVATPVGMYEMGAVEPGAVAGSNAGVPGLVVAGFVAWAAGVGVLGVMLVRRYRRVKKHWLYAVHRVDDAAMEVVNRCVSRIGLRTTPTVVVSGGVCSPAVVGVLRPVVVIPKSLLEAAGRQCLEHVLAHEFAHLRRRDPLAALICRLVQIVYWFHPVAWLMGRRLAALREVCSDAAAVTATHGEPEPYRRSLLEMARRLIGPEPAASLGFLPRRSQLMQRLDALRRPIADRAWLRRGLSLLTVLVLFVGLAPRAPVVRSFGPAFALDQLDTAGCLRLRYTVQAMLAAEQPRDWSIRE